ncbi:hypothetical protein D3C86_2027280 [compost metagenome]
MLNEPGFARDAAAIAGHRAIFADDPVTGDHDRDAVSTIGVRYGANGIRLVQLPG